MNKKFKIENNEAVLNLERLQYELDGRKEVMSFLIATNNISSDAYKYYENEYQKKFVEYQKAKGAFEKKYILPLIDEEDAIFSWNLDFSTQEVVIK